MKLIFSLLFLIFLFPIKINANDIILVSYHPSQVEVMKSLKDVMLLRMDFPDNFISFEESEFPCQKREVSAAHICLKKNGEIKFPTLYTETMKETLGTFWKEPANDYENK